MRNTILAVLMVMAVVTGQIPTNGLVARYDFTGGALTDGSGSGRTLTVGSTGATLTADRDLFPSNAYSFEGSISGHFYGSDNGLPKGDSDRTVCFWLSLAEKGDSIQQILAWGTPRSWRDTSMGFRVVFRQDTLCVQQQGVRYAKAKVTSAQFPADGLSANNPWTHVALVIQNKSARWYINGALHAEVAFPALATTTATNSYLLINGVATRYLKSKIDEILIYNRALTPTEVHGIYDPQVSTINNKNIATRNTIRVCKKDFSLNGRIVTDMKNGSNSVVTVRSINR
jgi:hypothetical protein